MSVALTWTLITLTALLVFAAGWKISLPTNSLIGSFGALALFIFHPTVWSSLQYSSPWDAFFVMVFVCCCLWLEHWSLFMRSWVLAVVYAAGLWLGTPMILWVALSLIVWIFFSRRPVEALIGVATILIGGSIMFALSWAILAFVSPTIGRPLFSRWVRLGILSLPLSASPPWCLLMLSAVYERFRHMIREHRAGASAYIAILLAVTMLLGMPFVGLSVVAISAPLIVHPIAQRDFLFHRGVRWTAFCGGLVLVGLLYGLQMDPWVSTVFAIVITLFVVRRFYTPIRLPFSLAAHAACVGAFIAEALGTVIPIR